MKKSLILLVLLLLFTAGCGDESAPVVVEPSLEDLVIANCYIVQQAAEDFAAQNNDVYPSDVDVSQNLDGNTLINLLPGGVQLTNPFTGLQSVPNNGAALAAGETAYWPTLDATGQFNDDYVISGSNRTGFIIQLTKDGPAP